MDSWTVQGDSYSLMRRAPRRFSLCHREGTPNHVEIFDIINIPTQRSVISETTCLCDIFGDDGESTSLSSSPAAGHSVPSKTEVEGRAATSPQVEDLNDSSESFHTAPGSSEGEEGFEDSKERYYSPGSHKECLVSKQLEKNLLNSEKPQVVEDSFLNFKTKSTTPLPHTTSTLTSITPSYQSLNRGEKTPSPGYHSPSSLSPERRLSSLSCSSAEKLLSFLSPDIQKSHRETESNLISPRFKYSKSSHSIQSLTPPILQDSFEPGVSQLNQNSSSSPETQTYIPQDCTNIFSPSIPHGVDSESPSEECLVSPEFRNHSSSVTTQAIFPYSELRGRVSVPDLFSRGFTSDINDSTKTTKPLLGLSISGRNASTSPQSYDTGSTGPGSSVSTPDPRYTPPSPVISASSLERVENRVSPGIRNTTASPHLLTPAFLANTQSRSPSPAHSPIIQNKLTLSAIGSQVYSPEVNNSYSSLPDVQQNSSPLGERYSSPSPEIRIASSSPKLRRNEQNSQVLPSPGLLQSKLPSEEGHNSPSPEVRILSSSPKLSRKETSSLGLQQKNSPLEEIYTSQSSEISSEATPPELIKKECPSQVKVASESLCSEQQFGSATPRSFTSSPHITGAFYSLQPEDRTSSPFSELSQISWPEPNTFLVSSKSGKNSVDIILENSTDSQINSPYLSDVQSSVSPSQLRDQEPASHSNSLTPSPELRPKTCSPDKFQNHLSKHQHRSPEPQFSAQRFQESPTALSTEFNPLFTKPVSLGSTSEFQTNTITAGITEIQPLSHLAKIAVSPLFQLERRLETDSAELKSNSSVVEVCTPISVSSDKNSDNSNIQIFTEREEKNKTEYFKEPSSVVFSTQEIHNTQTTISKEENKCPSHNITSYETIHSAASKNPLQIQENLYPLVPPTQGWTYTPQNSRRQPLSKVILDDRDLPAGDMSSHVNRRRTPSPPLTRFTPVHIIAPQKPHRKWQNRSNSPSQVLESSVSGKLKEEAANRENPYVDSVDNNSQAHWVRIGKQLEMDREIPLEQDRDAGFERQIDMKIDRERKREEQAPEREEGWEGAASYRGEQVELSFNATNRKGPASCSTAPTTKETPQGLPTANSFSGSLPVKRKTQQQQTLPKLASQLDPGGCIISRRLRPHTSQDRRSAPRRAITNRPCQSSSSSMGSELDEADHEVKWLTDVAFRSLSSPDVDYLEMYNSSHCSSTNISQPSTHESPAGVTASWLSYADFRGSAPKLDLDEISSHQQFSHSLDCLDPSRKCELGSFECIDVAVEREESRKVRRGVPKRQIQLKRRNNTQGKQEESSENTSPVLQVMVESLSLQTHPRGTFARQHSTPAAMEGTPPIESNSELFSQQKERPSKLQKSVSMDETCSKTKIASCLIKSVLSKKMQGGDRQLDEQASKEVNPESEIASEESQKLESSNLSSSLQSDRSISSEGFLLKGEPGMKDVATPHIDHRLKSSYRPSSSNSSRSVTFSQTESDKAVSQTGSTNSSASEIKSKFTLPFESKKSGETQKGLVGESVKNPALNTGALLEHAASEIQARKTNGDQETKNKDQHRETMQEAKDENSSTAQEITLKAVEKKMTSLNVCLTPEEDSKSYPLDGSTTEKEKKTIAKGDYKLQDEGNRDDRVKAPIHKVRDVRRLLKNTYNLSFKGGSPGDPLNVKEENSHEETKGDVSQEEKRDVLQEVSTEKGKEEREKQFWVERTPEKKEKANNSMTQIFVDSTENKINSPSSTQPMQIECKAVCWKDDTNELSNINEDLSDKPQGSLMSSPDSHSIEGTLKHTRNEERIAKKLDEHDISISTEKKKNVAAILKAPDNKDKPALARTDKKKTMLGSLPTMPSKEREVSTAVVLIREKSNQSNMSTSLSQENTSPHMKIPSSVSPGPSGDGSGGHSVSMLLKEKGYQADIGAVVSNGNSVTRAKGVHCKHVNSLEIPLQTITASERGFPESHRVRTFSSSSTTSGTSAVIESLDIHKKPKVEEEIGITLPKKEKEKTKKDTQEQNPVTTKQNDTTEDCEAVKRLDPTSPLRSPSETRFKLQPGETSEPSKETDKKEIPKSSLEKNKSQMIEVKSIAKNAVKPAVPPKPNCKFKLGGLGTVPNEAASSSVRQQNEVRPQTIVVSSPTVYRKIPNEGASASNYSRKLAVSSLSSLKPPPHRTALPTVTSISNMSKASSQTEAAADRGQQQHCSVLPESSRYAQKPGTLTKSETGLYEALQIVQEPDITKNIVPNLSEANHSTSRDPDGKLQYSLAICTHEQTMPVNSNHVQQGPAVSTTERYTHQLYSEHAQRIDEQDFYASDDPPSYDERESFSPLLLPDLSSTRSIRYQPSSRPPCSCTTGYPTHCGPTSSHQQRSPHTLTPPGPKHSPGSASPYQVDQPPLHPHQCRTEPQPMGYQLRSPKSSPLSQNQPPSIYQPFHHSAASAPHPSLMQACPSDRSMLSQQHIGPRRPPVHRSPHQQPPSLTGVYSDPGHGHSPSLPPIDPQYLCGPQSIGRSYSSEYGGDVSSVYSESGYAQPPRRVLMDPETGKYFYIEVPVQPLRKMLFDPETGQYVEVLIPQQTISNSGLYPPAGPCFQPLHNPNIYAPAPQYLPYAPPPPLAHPQVQHQPPQYPEPSAAPPVHPSGPGVSYRNPSGHGSKPEPKNHPSLDQRYLENMYYLPNVINASPNTTPPDYYHRHPSNLPLTGGKRS